MKSTDEILTDYGLVAMGVAFSTAFAVLSKDGLPHPRGIGPAITFIAVLASTLLLFARYIAGTHDDLSKAAGYVMGIKLEGSWHVIIIFALAICFGALIAYAANLIVYCGILFGLQIVDLIGFLTVRRKFIENEAGAKERMPSSEWRALKDYYCVRPHLLLRSLRLLGTAVALGIAVLLEWRRSAALGELAWAIVVASAWSAEYYHSYWRKLLKESLGLHPAH
ncbi:MAG TPA: hypothetical protein VND66_01500 [Acidobacteriaceae bacterium]|nr:hypothetical protein [Acidobacteriaceae bacterium]